MSFVAKHQSRCSECDELVHPGDTVRWSEHSVVVHVRCPEDRPAAEVCTTCWLEKPCGCENGQ